MGVPYFLEDGDFSVDSFDIGLVFDLVLLQDLDGNFIAGDDVSALLDLAECALALCFADDEASDLLTFAVFLLLGVLFFIFSGCCWLSRSSSLLVCLFRSVLMGF